MAPTQITSVAFEHHPSGFGIGHSRPRISWRLAGNAELKNWVQESYDVEIGRHGSSETTTHHVDSAETTLVAWPGRDLQSRESAWVKVRSHGRATAAADGQTVTESTEWSEAATVEAALLDKADWTAKLTADATPSDIAAPIRPVRFRKLFELPDNAGKIAKGRLYITAHGVYKAYLNGERIGTEEMAPGWTSYKHRLPYQIFDVTSALAEGKANNVLGVEVAEGWFAGRLGFDFERCFYGERLAFLAQLEVVFENGETFTLGSDSTWKSSPSAVTRSEIYDGEDYDARQEQLKWTAAAEAQNDNAAAAWGATEELEFPSSKLFASDSPPVRVLETIKPVKIFKSKSGKTLIDFGQNLVGKLQVRLPAPTAADGGPPEQLVFSHAEVLENEELGIRPLRDAKPVDRVILSSKQPEWWTPQFTFHGYRYAQVDGWPAAAGDGMPGIDDIVSLVMHSDMQRTGFFSCSDPLINQLHENVVWSLKGNFFSIPTDCPQRDERLGWTGDIQVFAPSAAFVYNVQGFLRSWLDDVSVEQLAKENGVPGLVVPDIFSKPTPPGPQCAWHDVTVLTPWDLYTSSGDVNTLRKQFPSMKAWVDVGIPRGSNGLWDQNVWQYGDWLDPAAPPDQPGRASTDSHLVADAYLVRVLETISKVCSVLGEAEDAARYAQDAAKTKLVFQSEYITPSGLVLSDTATAYSLAIVFGLFAKPEHLVKAANRLSHHIHNADYRISTGFVGTPLITHALSDTGHTQVAYRMLLEKSCPSWLYPITMGATTVWERWDSMLPDGSINPGSMTSFNHYALGSVINWLHKNVGGISPLEPGWGKIQVKPVPGGTLTSAKASHEGPHGRIESSWEIEANTFKLSVVVPPNSTAVVTLPGKGGETVTVGSGAHEFSCAYEAQEWPPKPEFERSLFRLGIE